MKGIFTILLSRFLYQIQLFLEDNFLKNRNFILKKKSSSIIDFWESWFLILKETFKDSRSRYPFPSFNGGKSNSKFLKNGDFYFNQKVIFNDPVVYFPWSPLYSRKIIFQKMEKAFFHFRKQYPNNEKKKKELAILLFNSTLEIQPFRNSNRTKNREFHFRKQLSNTRTRIATILSFASRIWFPKNRILEFLGAVIFTSYFSISIRRGEEGCIPNASVHTYAPIGYRCTWPNWKVDTLEFSGRKEPTSSRPPFSISFVFFRFDDILVVEPRSGYDESHLSWSRSCSIPPVHCVFAYSNEREEKKNENFSRFQLRRERVIISTVFSLVCGGSNYCFDREVIYNKWKKFQGMLSTL